MKSNIDIKQLVSKRIQVTYDLETFKQYALFTFLIPSKSGSEFIRIEFLHGEDAYNVESTARLFDVYKRSLSDFLLIGYNNKGYDNLIFLTLFKNKRTSPITPQEVNDLSCAIIDIGSLKWVNIPEGFLSYDVYNFKNHMPSLKIVGTLFGGEIHESPIPFSYVGSFTEKDRDEIKSYCDHDILRTRDVFDSDLGQKYFNMELMMCQIALNEIPPNKIDSVWRMFSTNGDYYEEIVKLTTDFQYKSKVNSAKDEHWIDFPAIYGGIYREFREQIEEVMNPVLEFFYSEDNFKSRSLSDGKDPSKFEIELKDGVVAAYGYGGVHGSCKESLYVSGEFDEYKVLHADFSAMYPNMMIEYDLYPPDFPSHLKAIFKKFALARDEYKKDGDIDTSNAYKPILNSVPGKFRYQYSRMFHPATNFAICAMGQCLVSFLALIVEGVLIQIDTDGIMILCRNKSEYENSVAAIDKFSKLINMKISTDDFDWFAQESIHSYAYSLNGKVDGIGGNLGGKSPWDPNLMGVSSVIHNSLLTGDSITKSLKLEIAANNVRNLIITSKNTTKFKGFQMVDFKTGEIEIRNNRFLLSVAVNPNVAASMGFSPKSITKIGEDKTQKISLFPTYVVNLDRLSDKIPIQCIDFDYYSNLIYSRMVGIASLVGIDRG